MTGGDLLDLLRYFIVFEDMGNGNLAKKMAAYHQFHAVNIALAETVRASLPVEEGERALIEPPGHLPHGPQAEGEPGDQRVGRGLAHAGVGEEPDHGVLCRARDPASRRCATPRWW